MACQPKILPWIDRCVNFGRRLPGLASGLLIEALLPDRCPLCGAGTQAAGFCDSCRACLPRHDNQCRACGVPLFAGSLCGSCLGRRPPIEATIAPFRYDSPISDWIHRLKYHRGLAYGRDLGSELAREVEARTAFRPDVLVPVPLHAWRQFRRGFNQSVELALPVSRELGIPVDAGLVTRRVNTIPQVGLRPAERRRNVNRAFAWSGRTVPRTAVIIDDVVTSGSTVRAVARCLARAGVDRVDVWALARL